MSALRVHPHKHCAGGISVTGAGQVVAPRPPVIDIHVHSTSGSPAQPAARSAGDRQSLNLLRANDAKVRWQAVLLSDADVGVRADVAVAMASRMDRVSAPALLALVTQEEMLEPWRRPNVVQAINILTGTYFGLTPGTPSPAVRTKAVTDFGQWIKEHPPEERTIR